MPQIVFPGFSGGVAHSSLEKVRRGRREFGIEFFGRLKQFAGPNIASLVAAMEKC
jgi:hypothetical protein